MRRIEAVYKKLKALDQGKRISAQELADAMGLSRANVSSDLNQLCREGKAIKSDGRPTFYAFLSKNLYQHVNIPEANIYRLGSGADAEEEALVCLEYERKICQCGGLDVAILGIGLNGHIAYNEPGTPFDSLTHVTQLTEQSREAARSFLKTAGIIPDRGITMGIRTIMNAKKILLLANGHNKSEMVHEALCGPINADIPASILKLHPNLTVVLDFEAAFNVKKTA